MALPNSIKILFYTLVVWYFIFIAGTLQFRRIIKKTRQIIMAYVSAHSQSQSDTFFEKVFDETHSDWSQMVKKSAWFILNKQELLPIPATIKNVEKRLGYSPEWIKNFLLKEEEKKQKKLVKELKEKK